MENASAAWHKKRVPAEMHFTRPSRISAPTDRYMNHVVGKALDALRQSKAITLMPLLHVMWQCRRYNEHECLCGPHSHEGCTDAEGAACLGGSVGIGLEVGGAGCKDWGSSHVICLKTPATAH